MIKEYKVAITTTQGAGAGTGEAITGERCNGYLVGLYISASVTIAATTDWTFTDSDSGINLFSFTDYATAGWIAPSLLPVGITKTAVTNAHRMIPITGRIKLAIAQADDGIYTVRYFIEGMAG